MLKGVGAQQVLEVVLTQVVEVLAMVKGGGDRMFPPFKKGGGMISFAVLRGGEVQIVSDPQLSHFVAPSST